MNTATIEDLAYLIKQAKEEGLPQPIVFLGAGASKTGGVPLASEIIKDILEKYKDSPRVKSLKEDARSYAKLMECLTPFERNKLLKGYIDRAKINVAHIYLAQLMIGGFVDYVLTVNFDNLMLRALALYNNFPATYDMAILKDLTTTGFKEKSVVYLHGQHHGLWLLNTSEELAKVNEIIPPIFNSIKNERPWIFIGYSGEDPIFEHITKLGRFDNGLYWVTYYDENPGKEVCSELLEKPNTNTFLIKGYDADSFMLKLNNVLNLSQPLIIDKPFTSLKNTLDNIVDIDDKEHFKGVKERLEIVKKDVGISIQQFEEGQVHTNEKLKVEIDLGLLKKQIIDKIINAEFNEDDIKLIEESAADLKNEEADSLLSELFNSWGVKLYNAAKPDGKVLLYKDSIEKYKTAAELNPKNSLAFSNWGLAFYELARLSNDQEFYKESFEKYKKATELNPKFESAFYNWGLAIYELAKLKNDEELYKQCFDKYEKAIEINPKYESAIYNWGLAIYELAKLKNDGELYKQCFNKYEKATEINPKYEAAFYNWGLAIYELAKLKNDKELYQQCFEKYRKATELIENFDTYNNWGLAIYELAKLINDEPLFKESIEKFEKATALNPKYEFAYDNWGNALSELGKLSNDETLYRQSFEKYKMATELNPLNDSAFYDWGNALLELAKLKNDEELYLQCFEMYKKATDINAKYDSAFYNWGNSLMDYAKLKNNEGLYLQALEKLNKSVELGGPSYNLACYYAITNNKPRALEILENSLQKKEVDSAYVITDIDWKNFLNDDGFKTLIKKYS
jgi:tetratricopeptide (TPR) repeat protein